MRVLWRLSDDAIRTTLVTLVLQKSFGSTQRGDSAFIDSVHCFHGKVPVDMTNATNTNISPGPGYKPSVDSVKYMPPNATFGTAKRTTPNMALVK